MLFIQAGSPLHCKSDVTSSTYRRNLGEWFTSFSSVLPTSQVVYCAGKPIERVVFCFYEITLEKVCQWEENLLYIKLLILIEFMRWRDKPITATERMKAQTKRRTQNLQSKATKTFRAKKVLRKERKRLSVKGRKYIN